MNELQIKIDQNKADQGRLQDEAEQLQSEFAAIDKPELKHGDYGFVGSKVMPENMRFFIENARGEIRHYEGQPNNIDPFECGAKDNYTILGNLFDDLKDMAEPLEEFEVLSSDSSSNRTIRVRLRLNSHCFADLAVRADGMWTHINLSEETLKELCQKSGRLIATAKRKAAK